MTDNLERRDLVDKADAWDAIAVKNAEITRLQEALAAAEAERDEERRIRRDMAERFFLPLGEPEPDPAYLPALLAETRKKALEEAAQVADDYAAGSDAEVKDSEEWGDAYGIDLNMQLSATANGIAAAIRSLSNEEAPE